MGFHLQSDPSIVNSICTGEVRQICEYVGMICRGNQRFDADQPHPVCDYPGQRSQGYPPNEIYGYIMQNGGTGQAFW